MSPRGCQYDRRAKGLTTLSALRQLQLKSETRRRILADPDIGAAALKTYLYLADELDDDRFQKRYVDSIAAALHLKVPTTAQALQSLIRRGYLERGAKIDRVWSYRLRWQNDGTAEKAG